MTAPNMIMRDPLLYRIRHAHHYRTGDKWCLYPMYDFAHCLSDALESITHSICTMEFVDHRPLYDWILDQLDVPCHPQQIEFARLNLEYTMMSKRILLELVEKEYVSGWDDPRMPTLVGMRRRGFTPESMRSFCERIGVGKKESWIGLDKLEKAVGKLDKQNRWVPAVPPLHFDKPRIAGVGPGDGFGQALAEAFPKKTIGLIPCAVGVAESAVDRGRTGGRRFVIFVRCAILIVVD